MSQSLRSITGIALAALFVLIACSGDDSVSNQVDDEVVTALHKAFEEFDSNETAIYIDGSQFVIETTGNPNHETVYWGTGHPLYKEEPDVNTTPSLIPNFDGSATLRVDATPELASSSTATSLGAIGIAVSGAAIFNDQEGNGPLSGAAVSLDYSGGHIGPGVYHYHLEPTAWSEDDDKLIGILADGFFIYGRKCNSTGDYPTDLDASGGHIHTTQHSDEPEYHYHIQNELYLNQYYIIFPGEYQGTPNTIN